MDETYIKIKGNWCYLCRAVDKYGKTVDFMVSKRRDAAAAKKFFRKAFIGNGLPHRVNIDKSGENNFELLQVKYLNNIVEQDHRHIKRITKPMGGFRKMRTAARTLAGIELMNMIKNKQLKFTKYIDQNLTPAEQFYRLAFIWNLEH